MEHFHKKRLLKLCDFLEQLPRKDFDFGLVAEHKSCGTVGCAIGWTPEVFPRLVRWTRPRHNLMNVALKDRRVSGYVRVARSLFGLTYRDAHSLFTPHSYVVALDQLPYRATPKQVARRIRKFLKLMESEYKDN